VVEELNAIYEQDFLGFSYGFPAGALTASRVGRARDRDQTEACELGARPGFPGDHVGTVIAESFHYFERIGPDGLAVDDAAAMVETLGVTLTSLEQWIRSQEWTPPQPAAASTSSARTGEV
jgi:hypothetical protein